MTDGYKMSELLRDEEFVLVLAVLVSERDNASDEDGQQRFTVDRCSRDLIDVAKALHTTGHCIVPCGAIDAVKRMLDKYGTKGGKIL